MDHAAVHSDRRARMGGIGASGFLDSEADVPAEGVLDEPSASDPTLSTPREPGQISGPAEPYSPDEHDGDLTPSTIQADDSKIAGLRKVDGQMGAAPLESGRSGEAVEETAPGADIVLQDLLAGLCGKFGEPLPSRQRVDAGGPDLPIHLCDRRCPSDTAAPATPTVPFVQQIPQGTGRMALPIHAHQLSRSGIQASDVRAVPHFRLPFPVSIVPPRADALTSFLA
jgi:hypothetical protein